MGDPVTIMAIASSAIGTIQQQSQARAQQRAQQEAANRQIQQQQLQQSIREKQQRDEAKRNQATARASFGARGVTSTGGSANALLQGINTQTEQNIANNRQLTDFSIESLRQNQQAQKRQSLLQSRNSILNSAINIAGSVMKAPSPSGGIGESYMDSTNYAGSSYSDFA